MGQSVISFETDGRAIALADCPIPLATFGNSTMTRASYILPDNALLRLAFRALRFTCRDGSKLAQWSRGWRCVWQVRLAASPDKVSFRHPSRAACLRWEHRTINRRLLNQ